MAWTLLYFTLLSFGSVGIYIHSLYVVLKMATKHMPCAKLVDNNHTTTWSMALFFVGFTLKCVGT
jgi:hypothetical protein